MSQIEATVAIRLGYSLTMNKNGLGSLSSTGAVYM